MNNTLQRLKVMIFLNFFFFGAQKGLSDAETEVAQLFHWFYFFLKYLQLFKVMHYRIQEF